jgi:sulfur relay (sulfurtransferase) complex TusBCD TusD component (DsrE family)
MMTGYLFIETRDPFESRDTEFVAETAAALKERDNEVTVFLVQNGVLAARRGARDPYLARLAQAGVRVLADDFSLRERGIAGNDLRAGVSQSSVGALVEMLARGETKAIWH